MKSKQDDNVMPPPVQPQYWSGEGTLDVPGAPVSFDKGQPGADLIPSKRLASAMQQVATNIIADNPMSLQYGLTAGPLPFREKVAEFATRHLRCPVQPEEIFASASTSAALGILARGIIRQSEDPCNLEYQECGRECLVEVPSYYHAEKILRDAGCSKVIGLPRTDDIISAVERELRQRDKKFPFALVYLCPTFHNPTGLEVQRHDIERLAALAEEYNTYFLLDEPYNFLSFTGSVIPHGASIAREQNLPGSHRIISLVSFSKIFAPGLRAGWVQGDPAEVRKLYTNSGSITSGGGVNPISCMLIAEMLQDHEFVDSHLKMLRRELGERTNLFADAIEAAPANLGLKIWHRSRGGYFTMLQGPWEDTSSEAFQRDCIDLGIRFMPAKRCVMTYEFPKDQETLATMREMNKRCLSSVRVSVSMTSRKQIERGVQAIFKLAQRYI